MIHFILLVFFSTPWKHKKTFGRTFGFLMFSWGIERDQWYEIGYVKYSKINEEIRRFHAVSVFHVQTDHRKISACLHSFCKKAEKVLLKNVLENCKKFTGKLLCWSLSFNKAVYCSLQLYWKETLNTRLWCFPCEFCEYFL